MIPDSPLNEWSRRTCVSAARAWAARARLRSPTIEEALNSGRATTKSLGRRARRPSHPDISERSGLPAIIPLAAASAALRSLRATPGRILGLAVAADRLDRAAFQSLRAGRDILFGDRLLAHIGVPTLFGSAEESWRRLTAQVAVDALLVDIEFPGGVRFPLVCFIGHGEPRTKTNAVACQGYPGRHNFHE